MNEEEQGVESLALKYIFNNEVLKSVISNLFFFRSVLSREEQREWERALLHFTFIEIDMILLSEIGKRRREYEKARIRQLILQTDPSLTLFPSHSTT